uniref:Uncharacterized protein n=1 Tax=Theropithecus gelada TaxID=9565 RepID=A0A8D2FCT4_THEGE
MFIRIYSSHCSTIPIQNNSQGIEAFCVFLVRDGSDGLIPLPGSPFLAGLKLLTSGDPLASASQSALQAFTRSAITGVSHHALPIVRF